MDPIVPFLTTNRTFQILRLNNNGLGPEGGAIIADALYESAVLSEKDGKKSQLRTVICGRNRLENGSAPNWGKAFAKHGGLEEIRMPQNGIRAEGIAALVRGIAKCPGLKHLDLQDNTFSEENSKDGANAITESLDIWTGLETLNLSDCCLLLEEDDGEDGDDPLAIVKKLTSGSNPKLQTLQLQNNNLNGEWIVPLAENIVVHLPALKTVELQWNEFEEDDESVASLKRTLKKRGGKLIIDDEEEAEEGDEEEEEEKEKEEEAKDPAGAAAKKAALEKESDDLAALMSKVSIET